MLASGQQRAEAHPVLAVAQQHVMAARCHRFASGGRVQQQHARDASGGRVQQQRDLRCSRAVVLTVLGKKTSSQSMYTLGMVVMNEVDVS